MGKRVMAYTMPGPQANRGIMAGCTQALITLANGEERVMDCTMYMVATINAWKYLSAKIHLVALGPMIKYDKHLSAQNSPNNLGNGSNGTRAS